MSLRDKTAHKMEPTAQIWCGMLQQADNNMYLLFSVSLSGSEAVFGLSLKLDRVTQVLLTWEHPEPGPGDNPILSFISVFRSGDEIISGDLVIHVYLDV